jgi:hypothetical protein
MREHARKDNGKLNRREEIRFVEKIKIEKKV